MKRHLLLGRKAMRYLDSGLKGRDSILPMKIPLSGQSYGVSSSLLGMRELDHKEGWAWNCRCFGTVVLEKPLEGPLDCKEIKPINHKGNQPWIFIGRTDAEVETSILWPPDMKSKLIGKDPDAEKDWGQEEKGVTEDEMVGWHPQLNGHEFQHTLGDSEEQGSLAYCSRWGHRIRHNWETEQQQYLILFFEQIVTHILFKREGPSWNSEKLEVRWEVVHQVLALEVQSIG